MAIQDVIDRMAAVIETVSGIKGASAYLPEALPSVDNWVVIYPGDTQFEGGNPAGSMTALYNVIIEIHTPRGVLPHSIKSIMDYFDAIPLAIFDDLFSTLLNTTVSTIGVITSTGLISMNYAGIDTIGFRYVVTGVKLQSEIR